MLTRTNLDPTWHCDRFLSQRLCPRASFGAVFGRHYRSLYQLARHFMASSSHGRHRIYPLYLFRPSSQDRSGFRASQYSVDEGISAVQSSSSVQNDGISQHRLHTPELRFPQFLTVLPSRSATTNPRQYIPLNITVDIRSLLHCSSCWFPAWYGDRWASFRSYSPQMDC
jgi:hypothetical protein